MSKLQDKTQSITKRGPSSAAIILDILSKGAAPLTDIAKDKRFRGIRFARIQDAADKLFAKGTLNLAHVSNGQRDVYTLATDKTQSITKRKKPSSDPTKKAKTKTAPRKRKAKTLTISPLSPMIRGAKHATREDWLLAAVAAVRPLFDEIGADAYPPLRVSCGWPKGGRKSVGQCWPSTRSGDKTIEIFLSPALDDVEQIVAVTIHELIHAIDNCENQHKGPFRKIWQAIGFEGKATVSTPGQKLADSIRLLLGNLGPYPHSRLDASLDKKQGTRMLKVVCTDEECGYTLRTTQKWIDLGLPTCYCGCFMVAE